MRERAAVRFVRWMAVACVLVVAAPAARASELQDDLQARRARVMERLDPESLLILFSAPTRVYSGDVDYEYRQESNLYYLTGIEQPDTILVLMPGNQTRKAMLFIRPRDPLREHWDGRRLSRAEASMHTGIEAVFETPQFEPFITAILSRQPYGLPAYTASSEFDVFFKALAEGRATLALLFPPRPGLQSPLDETLAFVARVKERFAGFRTQDASPIFRDLRRIKTPYEQKVLERSVQITSEAHLAGMRAARPGAYEYEVKAAVEHVFVARGGSGWAYPSIVGSGSNATILHYTAARRRMEAGELLLVDAGASYGYMAADVTRTYPVSGVFSEPQKDVYQIVLAAQEAGIEAARRGARLTDVHARSVEVIKQGLLKLGLITDTSGDQYRLWSTHGTSHYIGLDVHDVGRTDQPLEPGVAFTIEPGIYVRQDALETLPSTPENAAFAARIRPAFEKYRNIGIRIEDSFLLTEGGLRDLSGAVPRTIEEIEGFMRARPAR